MRQAPARAAITEGATKIGQEVVAHVKLSNKVLARNNCRNALETVVLESGVVTEGAMKQGRRGVGRTSSRAAAWVAWSMWAFALMSFVVSGVIRFLNASTPTVEPR